MLARLRECGPGGIVTAKWTGKSLAGLGVALAVALTMGLARPASGAEDEKKKMDCPHAGQKLDAQQLKTILEKHAVWLKNWRPLDPKVEGRAVLCMANLRNANLQGANLQGANLEGTDLQGANLESAKLQKANLFLANLQGANLQWSDLRGADLSNAELGKADLKGAKLQGAKLQRADLQGAELDRARLEDADLRGANLQGANLIFAHSQRANFEGAVLVAANLFGADLRNANLQDTILALSGGTTLKGADFAEAKLRGASLLGLGVKNLAVFALLDGRLFPTGLVSVRENFKIAGEREAERYLTFLIKRHDRRQAPPIEAAFGYILFEATSDWGYEPGRPLKILGALILIFALVYLFPIGRTPARTGAGGIYRIWPEGRLKEGGEAGHQTELAEKAMVDRLHLTNVVWVFFYALFFSLLSAFQIGWRDLNVGSWLARLQAREYNLRARGWVRVVSGLQSLISVYLLALWALVYFGRPFQ